MVDIPEIKGPSIALKNPTTRGFVANMVIFSQVIGIIVIAMMEYNILLDLSTTWVWIPLGGLLFALIGNPLLLLGGFKEPLSVMLSALHFLFYIYVARPESLRNALIVFFMYTIVVLLFEFPRRIEFK